MTSVVAASTCSKSESSIGAMTSRLFQVTVTTVSSMGESPGVTSGMAGILRGGMDALVPGIDNGLDGL